MAGNRPGEGEIRARLEADLAAAKAALEHVPRLVTSQDVRAKMH